MKLSPPAFAAALCFVLAPTAHAQKIVAVGDEWVLSDTAFSVNTTSTTNFALNIAREFGQDNGTGNFLAYSNNFGLRGASLAATMTGAGYGWTADTTQPFTLAALNAYDAVFLAGIPGSGEANASVLQAYVNGGGNVYVGAGAGEHGSAIGEASAWRPFLSAFGLEFGNSWFEAASVVNIALTPSTNPLQTDMTTLTWGFGQTALPVNPADPLTATAITGQFGSGNQSLVATYNIGTNASVTAPEPSGLALLVLPLVGAIAARRRKIA